MDDQTTPGTQAPTDADPAPGTGITPGERRLSRPPSDRYRTEPPGPAEPPATDGASPTRGIAVAVVTAIVVGAVITFLGGVLLVTAGLIVVAAAGGWAVALAVRLGARATLDRPSRRWLAIGLALGAVVIGQIGLWLFARTEGGVLPIVDYLAETFGILVPLEALAAAIAAAWTAR